MRFHAITWEDKNAFDRIMRDKSYEACEYRFSHLYIWKDADNIRICVDGDTVYICECKINGCMMPITSDITDAFLALERHYEELGEPLRVYGVTAEAADELRKTGRYNIEEMRELYDYLYNAEDIISLRGKKYHSKRNHISKFKELYNYEFSPMRPNDISECLEMERAWAGKHGDEGTVNDEKSSIENAIYNMDKLGLTGGIIRVNNKLAAFTIGQATDSGMGIVHFEKADTDYTGIYAAINQMYAEYAFSGMQTINRQDDMGLENLRKAKLSYHPARLVEKYKVTLK